MAKYINTIVLIGIVKNTYLRFSNKKLLVILTLCDGSFCDSPMLKHVIVIHYLQKPKSHTERQNSRRKNTARQVGRSSDHAGGYQYIHCVK